MAEAIGNETDSTCPPSDEYLPVDEGDDYGPEELSYTDLIEELEQDISEYELLNNKMLIAWEYYAPLPDGKDVYVDFSTRMRIWTEMTTRQPLLTLTKRLQKNIQCF